MKIKNSRVTCDVERLKYEEISKQHKEEFENRLVSVNINELSTNEVYTHISKIITSIAQHIFGKYRFKKEPCIINDIVNMCSNKKKLK